MKQCYEDKSWRELASGTYARVCSSHGHGGDTARWLRVRAPWNNAPAGHTLWAKLIARARCLISDASNPTIPTDYDYDYDWSSIKSMTSKQTRADDFTRQFIYSFVLDQVMTLQVASLKLINGLLFRVKLTYDMTTTTKSARYHLWFFIINFQYLEAPNEIKSLFDQ